MNSHGAVVALAAVALFAASSEAQDAPAPPDASPPELEVVVKTPKGSFTIRLRPDVAPRGDAYR